MPSLPRFDLHGLAADALRFAKAFPGIAGELARSATDPSTERLVDGSRYLAGVALDTLEDFELDAHELLAQRASPALRRSIPSATVVAFDNRDVVTPMSVSPTTPLVSISADGVARTFRPVTSVLVSGYCVRATSIESRPGRSPILHIVLESTASGPLNEAVSRGLSLYVGGELETALEIVHALCCGLDRATVMSKDWSEPLPLCPARVVRGGLGPEESLTPDPDGPSPLFGAITEACVCPDRFRFVRVGGLNDCARAKATTSITLAFELRESLSPRVDLRPELIRTNCATVVNLFDAWSEPLALDFERGPVPIHVAGLPSHAAGVYAVREAWATATRGEHGPVPLPDVRRLGAGMRSAATPALYATSLEPSGDAGDAVSAIAFSRLATSDDIERAVSLRILATNGRYAARLRAGDFGGDIDIGGRPVRFRNLTPSSAFVPPPTGLAFARRAIRLAAVPPSDMLDALRDALYLAVPSWAGESDEVRSQHLRVEGLRSFDVAVGRRALPGGATQHGYAYTLIVDESAFQGVGDLSLFGAVLSETLSRAAPVNTFATLALVGARTGFHATYARSQP